MVKMCTHLSRSGEMADAADSKSAGAYTPCRFKSDLRHIFILEEMTQSRTSWATIKFKIAPDHEDLACWLMIQNGAQGCEVEQEGAQALVKAYFEPSLINQDNLNRLASQLEEFGLGSSLPSLEHESLEEQDWLSRFKASFQSFEVADKFFIAPPWAAEAAPDFEPRNRTKIVIDPAMAFGTGLHTTTQFCLSQIGKSIKGPKVADIGTGSGILAIATALLYPDYQITGIDNDAVALENARENVITNGVGSRIQLVLGIPEDMTAKFNCLLSNITCEDIIALLPTYQRILLPGGEIVCAGILLEKAEKLALAAEAHGFKIVLREPKGEWIGMVLERSA